MRNILIFALLLIVAIGSAQDDKFRADQTFIEYTGKASDTICESGTWDREYLVNKDLPYTYNIKVSLDTVENSTNTDHKTILYGRVHDDDDYTKIDSVTWSGGIGSYTVSSYDTTFAFTSTRTTYHFSTIKVPYWNPSNDTIIVGLADTTSWTPVILTDANAIDTLTNTPTTRTVATSDKEYYRWLKVEITGGASDCLVELQALSIKLYQAKLED